jgi:hypothetical protein
MMMVNYERNVIGDNIGQTPSVNRKLERFGVSYIFIRTLRGRINSQDFLLALAQLGGPTA